MHMTEQRARDLLRLAGHDLRAAEVLRREAESLNVVAFLAQQAIEKAIKAVLVCHDVNYPRTHDIAALLGLAQPLQVGADQFDGFAENLQHYGVSIRYDIELFPTVEAVEQALKIARRTLAWAQEIVHAKTGEARHDP